LYAFSAFKKFKDSGREIKVSGYSGKNITRKNVGNLKQEFMQWVITG
jgi:hypothetical protein